jgi:hypothetical protein
MQRQPRKCATSWARSKADIEIATSLQRRNHTETTCVFE